MHELLELDARRELFTVIQGEPGITKTEVRDASGYAWGTIHYHLGRLQDNDLIRSWRQRKQLHFFTYEVSPTDFEAITALRKHLSTSIIKRLQEEGEAQMYELARDLDTSRKTIRSHLNPLTESGVIEKQGERRPKYRASSGSLGRRRVTR